MPDLADLKERVEHFLEQIALATEQKPLSEVRRASWRYTAAVFATLESADPNDPFDPLHITTTFISADGMQFRSSRTFDRGDKVLITLDIDQDPLQIPATVIHVTTSVGMPIVGLRFDL